MYMHVYVCMRTRIYYNTKGGKKGTANTVTRRPDYPGQINLSSRERRSRASCVQICRVSRSELETPDL